ncbi:RsmB/NOP family class I SAM-dependent RNA methyltransferase [Candidatus Saccharibacteria bacterium]|nr:RsmB/NOP family class I SAM-dependent RNA methyltransferase [Candidatus Saccharibacteria bacterium]MCA9328655.1 RsmB/NOP family class I SAM-dependent RNA methyltransferase [Candidatus Saccharibacteria bacterium]
MSDNDERFAKMQDALSFLGKLEVTSVKTTLCAPFEDDLSSFGFKRVEWAPYMWIGDEKLSKDHRLFTENKVFSIGLASVLACLQLNLKAGDKVLDMCAAPGIKSLYLQLIHDKKLDLYVNDTSHVRLERLRALFSAFSVPLPIFSNQPGQSLHNRYNEAFFDAILIDAPCSGEGNILKGDTEALKTWSQAKVKRLAEIQRKLIKTGQKLVKTDGQLVYATCTLNQYENEGTIKKAGIELQDVQNTVLEQIQLEDSTAVRLLSSVYSIGFFVAKLK